MILLLCLLVWMVEGTELALGVFFGRVILSIPFKAGYTIVRRLSR